MEGAALVDGVTAHDLAVTPSSFYARIDRGSDGTPLLRGQGSFAQNREHHAVLDASGLVPPGSPDVRGGLTIVSRPDGSLDFLISMKSPATSTVSTLELVEGGPGGATLQTAFATATGQADLRTASAAVSLGVSARLRHEPSGLTA